MSVQIETARVVAFARGIRHLAEQKMSRFRGAVRFEGLMTGKREYFDQIGAVTATKQTSRHADTPQTDTPHYKRAVDPAFFAHADLLDDPDKLRVINDPTNAYAVAFGRAFARAMDDEVVAAAFATSVTGEDGGSTAAFDTTNYRITSGSAGLTLAKLVQANKILRAAENDPDEGMFIAVSQEQIEDMLNDPTITSADYNSVRLLMTGEITQFMGFTWIPSERLGTTAGERRCIAWARNSLLLGALKEPMTRVSERADKNYTTQVYMCMDIGATRMDETGVVEILCTE